MNLNEAQTMANELIQRHCPDYSFRFNNRKSSFGLCDFEHKRIELSRLHTQLEPQENVKNTLLHEIAHALAGYENGHNRVWKQIARSLGHATPPKSTCEPVDRNKLPYKWVVMYNDQVVHGYYRRPGRKTIENIGMYSIKGKPETRGKLELLQVYK